MVGGSPTHPAGAGTSSGRCPPLRARAPPLHRCCKGLLYRGWPWGVPTPGLWCTQGLGGGAQGSGEQGAPATAGCGGSAVCLPWRVWRGCGAPPWRWWTPHLTCTPPRAAGAVHHPPPRLRGAAHLPGAQHYPPHGFLGDGSTHHCCMRVFALAVHDVCQAPTGLHCEAWGRTVAYTAK